MKRSILILASGITLLFGLMLGTTVHLSLRISNLEDHHKSKYPQYSYAYDCIMEAELKYWETKANLVKEVQNYIDSVAPTSNLRAYAIVDECERFNIDLVFVLTQGEIESHFGTKGLGSKLNNVFNIGVFDGLSADKINKQYKFDYPNQSIEPYLELLNERYLVNKVEADLMNKYVDVNGKRYDSNPDYENMFKTKYNYICNNTTIDECVAIVNSWAIKCNR